jgi:hypothetical protein
MGILDKVGNFVKTEGLEDVALAELHKLVDGYKKVIAVLEPLGFKMGKFSVVMGVLPEIHTSISGSVKDINEDALKKLMDEHQSEALLVTLLKTLILTKKIWDHMESKLTSATINLTLGISPKVTVDVS